MITTVWKKLLDDAVDTLTRSELWSKSSWLLRNRRRQRSALRAVYPELLHEARDVPEPTPTGSASASEPAAGSHQLAARGAESADHPGE